MNTLGNVQARAYPVIKDKNTNRPILGVAHVLAFNSDLFPYFNKLPN